MDTCIHLTRFNVRESCLAGVDYLDALDVWTIPESWACYKPHLCGVTCPKARYATREEAEEQADYALDYLDHFIAAVQEGVCPHCGVVVDDYVDDGDCVWCSPCGCALYER